MRVIPLDRPHVLPYLMPARFKTDIAYFMTPGGDPGVPPLGPNEYYVRLDDARKWVDELVVSVVSPLAAEAKAELELTEEQEAWLAWMVEHQIQHVRLES
ncbi:MAG TPA: hypothetical protein VL096_09270 [Pirellulaceae bacterium]|nr:hypothetical protein [Pirellulaceae bacterium]